MIITYTFSFAWERDIEVNTDELPQVFQEGDIQKIKEGAVDPVLDDMVRELAYSRFKSDMAGIIPQDLVMEDCFTKEV